MRIESKPSQMNEKWDEETLFQDGDSYFSDILNSIQTAKKTIKIETYIFDRDELGEKILNALRDAAERGVKVRLLLDGAGCSEWDHDTTNLYRKHNFEIRFFHPLIWQRRNRKLWKYLNLKRIVRGFSLLNHRNHRKIFLFDNETAYLGSMNISGNHLKSSNGSNVWRDSSVRIKGDKISILSESLDEAWNYFHNYSIRSIRKSELQDGGPLLYLNRTIRQRRQNYHSLVKRLNSAQISILITNPYFIPTLRLRRILKAAASKDIRVATIFPEKSDVWQAKLAMEGFYSTLLKSGIEIHEYQPSMIHAKILITDDMALLGSSNMNTRSLFLDLEVDVEITHPENIEALKKQFEEDLKKTKKIELMEWKKRPLIKKTAESIFILFRWML